jgi:hypothetical protein
MGQSNTLQELGDFPSVWNKNKPALQAHRARTLQIYSTSDKLNRGTEMRPVAAFRRVNCFWLTRKNHPILRNPLQKLLVGAVLFGVVPGMTILCPALIYVLVNIASYGCFCEIVEFLHVVVRVIFWAKPSIQMWNQTKYICPFFAERQIFCWNVELRFPPSVHLEKRFFLSSTKCVSTEPL